MPIFDFTCHACHQPFELITRNARSNDDPVCPHCGSKDVEKQLSMFKVGAPSLTPAQKEQQSMERAGWVKVGKPQKR
jgi:putative FmdB family regulatory protein